MPVGEKAGIQMPSSYTMSTKYDPVALTGNTLFPTEDGNKRYNEKGKSLCLDYNTMDNNLTLILYVELL